MIRRSTFLAGAVCALAAAALQAQIPEEVEVRKVATGLRYPAGLAWSREGYVVVADLLKREIYRLDPNLPPKPTGRDSNAAQGLAYDSQSRLYICEPGARKLVRMDKRGTFETVADSFEGKKLNAPSDVAVRRDGNAYFTDPAFAGAIDHRDLTFNGVFHVTSKGETEAVARWQTRPNGVALTPDGKTLYVSDADRHSVVAFDLDAKGNASNPRDVIKAITGVPAGLKVDAGGRIFVAAQGIAIYTPAGKLMRTLLVSERTINCSFGDADLESLYVSTLKTVYRIRVGVKGALQY